MLVIFECNWTDKKTLGLESSPEIDAFLKDIKKKIYPLGHHAHAASGVSLSYYVVIPVSNLYQQEKVFIHSELFTRLRNKREIQIEWL